MRIRACEARSTTFIFGIVLALSRLWTGSLIPAVTAHVLIDLMVGFVALRSIGSVPGRGESKGTGRCGYA